MPYQSPVSQQASSFISANEKNRLKTRIAKTIQAFTDGSDEENKATFEKAFKTGKQDYYEATSMQRIEKRIKHGTDPVLMVMSLGLAVADSGFCMMERSRINEPLKLKPTDIECSQIGILAAIYRYLEAKQKDEDKYTILYKYYVVQAILDSEFEFLKCGWHHMTDLNASPDLVEKIKSFIEVFQAELHDHLFVTAKPGRLLYPNEATVIDSKIETVLTNLTHQDLEIAFNKVLQSRPDLKAMWGKPIEQHSFWKSPLPISKFSYFLLKTREELDENEVLNINARSELPIELLDAFLHLAAKDDAPRAQSISYLFTESLTGISLRKADGHGNVYSAQELNKHAVEWIGQFRDKVPAKCYQAGCPANEVRNELLTRTFSL